MVWGTQPGTGPGYGDSVAPGAEIDYSNPFALSGDYMADLARYRSMGFGLGGSLGRDAGAPWMGQFGAEQTAYGQANPGTMFDPMGQPSAMGGFFNMSPSAAPYGNAPSVSNPNLDQYAAQMARYIGGGMNPNDAPQLGAGAPSLQFLTNYFSSGGAGYNPAAIAAAAHAAPQNATPAWAQAIYNAAAHGGGTPPPGGGAAPPPGATPALLPGINPGGGPPGFGGGWAGGPGSAGGPGAGGGPGPPPTPNPITLGGIWNSGGVGGNTNYGFPGAGGSAPPPGVTQAPGNFTGGQDMSSYFNPAFNNALTYGLDAVRGSYGAQGNYLSGPAMRGISDYASTMAANNLWQPAFQNYMNDRGFNYQVALNNATIPFQQQMALANLQLQNNQQQWQQGMENQQIPFQDQMALANLQMQNNQQQWQQQTQNQQIPFQQQLALAQMGLQGAYGSSDMARAMAALLSGNMANIGQIQGAGTYGANNAITNAISQWLSGMAGNPYNLQQIMQAYRGAFNPGVG